MDLVWPIGSVAKYNTDANGMVMKILAKQNKTKQNKQKKGRMYTHGRYPKEDVSDATEAQALLLLPLDAEEDVQVVGDGEVEEDGDGEEDEAPHCELGVAYLVHVGGLTVRAIDVEVTLTLPINAHTHMVAVRPRGACAHYHCSSYFSSSSSSSSSFSAS